MKEAIIKSLPDHKESDVIRYATYLDDLSKEKKDGKQKNYWMSNFTTESFAELFKRVSDEGLVLDGSDITVQSHWSSESKRNTLTVSYNYQAYKNKMLLAYPETEIDVQLVYEGDTFSFAKETGKVVYNHSITNPFSQKDDDIIGAYCILKNQRGQFLTTMSPEDIEKHRKVAKTDYIWRKWFKEMCLKTVIKKACGKHFKDKFKGIESMDNENSDIESSVDVDLQHKQAIENITTINGLKDYYNQHKSAGKDVLTLLSKRKELIQSNQ